jgi:hypothetical protein
MAPRTRSTRRSKTIVITDNSQLTVAEDQAQLQAGTHRNTGNIQQRRETTSTTTIATNARQKGKSQLSSVRLI